MNTDGATAADTATTIIGPTTATTTNQLVATAVQKDVNNHYRDIDVKSGRSEYRSQVQFFPHPRPLNV